VVLSNGKLLSNKSGLIKECNQTSSKMGTGSDQSSVRSWLVQPIKELSSAAGLCAGKGCALIRQLANWSSGQLQTARFMYNEQKCSFFLLCAHI